MPQIQNIQDFETAIKKYIHIESLMRVYEQALNQNEKEIFEKNLYASIHKKFSEALTKSGIKNMTPPGQAEVSNLSGDSKTIVIGDVHGTLDLLIQNLYLAGVIDRHGNYNTKNNKHLIQLGDMYCRGNYQLETHLYLKMLQKQAGKENGKDKVIRIFGNHEAYMFDLGYNFTNKGRLRNIKIHSHKNIKINDRFIIVDLLKDDIENEEMKLVHGDNALRYIAVHGGFEKKLLIKTLKDIWANHDKQINIQKSLNPHPQAVKQFEDMIQSRITMRSTDIYALMEKAGITLEHVAAQINQEFKKKILPIANDAQKAKCLEPKDLALLMHSFGRWRGDLDPKVLEDAAKKVIKSIASTSTNYKSIKQKFEDNLRQSIRAIADLRKRLYAEQSPFFDHHRGSKSCIEKYQPTSVFSVKKAEERKNKSLLSNKYKDGHKLRYDPKNLPKTNSEILAYRQIGQNKPLIFVGHSRTTAKEEGTNMDIPIGYGSLIQQNGANIFADVGMYKGYQAFVGMKDKHTLYAYEVSKQDNGEISLSEKIKHLKKRALVTEKNRQPWLQRHGFIKNLKKETGVSPPQAPKDTMDADAAAQSPQHTPQHPTATFSRVGLCAPKRYKITEEAQRIATGTATLDLIIFDFEKKENARIDLETSIDKNTGQKLSIKEGDICLTGESVKIFNHEIKRLGLTAKQKIYDLAKQIADAKPGSAFIFNASENAQDTNYLSGFYSKVKAAEFRYELKKSEFQLGEKMKRHGEDADAGMIMNYQKEKQAFIHQMKKEFDASANGKINNLETLKNSANRYLEEIGNLRKIHSGRLHMSQSNALKDKLTHWARREKEYTQILGL